VIENPTKICTKVNTQRSALSENHKFKKFKKFKISVQGIQKKNPKESTKKSKNQNQNHFTPYLKI
jgi:hypothetical protein